MTPVSPTLAPTSDQLFPLLPPNSLAMALQQQQQQEPSTLPFRSSFPATVFSQNSLSPATNQHSHSQVTHALYEGHRPRVLYENSHYQTSQQQHHLLNNGKHGVVIARGTTPPASSLPQLAFLCDLAYLVGVGRQWVWANLVMHNHMYLLFHPTFVNCGLPVYLPAILFPTQIISCWSWSWNHFSTSRYCSHVYLEWTATS